MKKKTVLTVFLTACALSLWAQGTIGTVLSEVEKNNKSLLAEKQYWEAQKLNYKTGLAPENPKAEIDYMFGRPEGAGNQQDVALTQGIDFPTSYGKKKSVSREQITNADHHYNSFRQGILLEAKQLCFEYIFRVKFQQELEKRLRTADELVRATNQGANQGETNILDLNKIKLLQLEIRNQYDLNATAIRTTQHKLDEMNGGVSVNLTELGYPAISNVPPFEELDSLIEANDPVIKAVKQEREIAQRQLLLTRSLTLPKLEGGYHRQAILGQVYEGFHFGMTLPLWENKNRVKTQQARLLQGDLQIQDTRTEHYFENKEWYEQYMHWKGTYDQYRLILGSANNEELLSKALQHGQINLIEYLMEARYFYEAINRSLEAERELHNAITQLYRFEL
jgi:cobalt-zinc-cadmium efflux system outer membrane protein